MARAIVERLRKWTPLTGRVVAGLIQVATRVAGAASPDNAWLIEFVGGAGGAPAEAPFDHLKPDEKRAAAERLLPLLDAHAALIAELEPSPAAQRAPADDITAAIREALDRQPALRADFDRF